MMNLHQINLDIGGQLNRNDQSKKWLVLDMLEGADHRVNLENDSLPFPDAGVDNIYTSHCLEHLEPCRLRFVFSDFFRVLKKAEKYELSSQVLKREFFTISLPHGC